jgi:hypothetical protein
MNVASIRFQQHMEWLTASRQNALVTLLDVSRSK